MKTRKVTLHGGPYSGKQLRVSESCRRTLTFRVGNKLGFYSSVENIRSSFWWNGLE